MTRNGIDALLGFLASLAFRYSTRAAFAACVVLCGSAPAKATEIYVSGFAPAYASVMLGKLTVSGNDVSFSQVAGNLTATVSNLAYRDEFSFYAQNEYNALITVAKATGAVTVIGGTSSDSYWGLVTMGGTLYGATTTLPDDYLQTVDTSTGARTNVGLMGLDLTGGNGGRLSSLGSTLYLTNGSAIEQGLSQFGTVNASTGAYTQVGANSADYANLMLAGVGSTLYGIDQNTSRVYTVAPDTGALTALNPTTGTLPALIFGAVAINPVPEPATYAMALAGLACGGFSMWRRKRA